MWRYIVYVALGAVAIYFIDDYCNGCKYESDVRIDDKVVIVTGGNTGIGKETVKDLVKRGAKVYVGCRSLTRGQAAIDDIKKETGIHGDKMILLQLDLSSFESVRDFVQEFRKREQRLDILINSAGVMFHPYNITVDGFETTFAVNHLGHFLLTQLLTDFLVSSAPSRVVTVSSLGHMAGTINFDNLNGDLPGIIPFIQTATAYVQSKLANVLFAKELAKRLEGTGVSSYSLHPGSIKTELGRHSPILMILMVGGYPFLKDPYHGARTSICCAVEPGLEAQNGKYFSDCAEVAPSGEAGNEEIAQRLWDVSVDLVKLKPEEIHPKLL